MKNVKNSLVTDIWTIFQEMGFNKVNVLHAQPDPFQIALIRIAQNVQMVNQYNRKLMLQHKVDLERYAEENHVTPDLLETQMVTVKPVLTIYVLIRISPVDQTNVRSQFVMLTQLFWLIADVNHVKPDQEQMLDREDVNQLHVEIILVVKPMANAEPMYVQVATIELFRMDLFKEHANHAALTWLPAQTEDHATKQHAQTTVWLWIVPVNATIAQHSKQYQMIEEVATSLDAQNIPDVNQTEEINAFLMPVASSRETPESTSHSLVVDKCCKVTVWTAHPDKHHPTQIKTTTMLEPPANWELVQETKSLINKDNALLVLLANSQTSTMKDVSQSPALVETSSEDQTHSAADVVANPADRKSVV